MVTIARAAPPRLLPMPSTVELVAATLAAWDDEPRIVRAVFPDPTPAGIAAAVEGFCERALGAPVATADFFTTSVGAVHGLRLCDGRRVVVKVHPPRASVAYLEAMQAVQRHLAAAGFPAPVPLAPPTPLGRGVATAETLLDRGAPPDGRVPEQRRAMAAGLAELVALARPLAHLAGLRENLMAVRPGALWPTPHDGRFDFATTTEGAEWVDRIATTARALRDRHPAGDEVVGHTDWRAEHLRFADGRLSAVHDWDSLAVLPEPALVGSAAHAFPANWAMPVPPATPTKEEALAFIADYEAAREAGSFTAEDHTRARAALVYTMAYTARCEHSDRRTDLGRRAPAPWSGTEPASVPAGGALAFLATHAAELLGTEFGPTRPVPEVVASS
jgi:Phosphotransferase enzyme family